MGSKILYKVATNAVGHYVVHADSDFVAAFKHSADAYDFIDVARQRDDKARGVEPVVIAVAVSDRSEYELGGDAYEAGSPYDMYRSQDWRDGWEDTKDLLEQGK